MPILAYRCRACGNQFQTLVRSGEAPVCEACRSSDLDQQLSLIATPNKGSEANTGMGARGAGMGSCACAESVCPTLGRGQP
jgi:putative FmdB family regulatory protein